MTKNRARAALKQFGDRLVQRQVIAQNPFATVRSQKHHPDGKTPEITVGQARELLLSIDISTLVGLRDRAVLRTLVYTGARVGVVARLRCRDLQDQGSQRVPRFLAKNARDRETPVRHDLEERLLRYMAAAGLTAPPDVPLFQSAITGRPRREDHRQLSGRPLGEVLIRRMLKRRLENAGLPVRLRPHSFRALGRDGPAGAARGARGRPVLGPGTRTRRRRRPTTDAAAGSPAASLSGSPCEWQED